MILSPGNVFYYSGIFLLVFGNTVGVILGLIMILSGVWLWQREDAGDLEYGEPEDEEGCPICGAAPGEPCRTSPRSDAEPAPTYRLNLDK